MSLTAEQLALFPQQQTTMDQTTTSVGARAPTLKLVRAHTIDAAADRHRNPTKARISLWPDAEILDKVKRYCDLRRIPYSRFFELAALNLIEGPHADVILVGARPQTIDKKIDLREETDDTIIHLHRFWTAAYNRKIEPQTVKKPIRWTARDDDTGRQFNDNDIRAIECGILKTLAQIPPESGPIRGFSYYRFEINRMIKEASQLQEPALAKYHRHCVTKMRKWLNLPEAT